MKVGIRYHDMDYINDLHMFFELLVLPTFVEREPGHMVTHLTSSMLVDLFNHYLPYIKRYRDAQNHRGSYTAPLEKWNLSISEMEVYWDDQTDEYLTDWGSNAWTLFVWTDGKKVY